MKFYVYELIDPRDGKVFYVGKGQRDRVRHHVRDAMAGRIQNARKHRRIQAIHDAGLRVVESIVSRHETGEAALLAERETILAKMSDGLTNMLHGVVSDKERAIEQARFWLSRLKPFACLEATISPKRREACEAESGSLRAAYDDHVSFLRGIMAMGL